MADVVFLWDQATLRQWRGRLPQKSIALALQRAGSDSVRALRTSSTRQVRFRKNLKLGAVQDALVLRFPVRKIAAKGSAGEIDGLAWRMDVSGKRFGAIDYPARQTKRGVSVAITKGKRTMLKSAFIAKMNSGHEGVFLRAFATGDNEFQKTATGRLKKRKGKFVRRRVARLRIEEVFTTRVSDVFTDNGMIPAATEQAMKVFDRTFRRNAIAELNRLNKAV